jgi:CheY-like chemotaxis protein
MTDVKNWAEYILNGKKILAVDDEPDILEVLEGEILGACPTCKFDKSTSYEAADKMMKTQAYDIVILDIMGVRGFELLDLAVSKNMKVAMFTAHALNPQALERSFKKGARAYIPKEKLGEIVPYLENILTSDYAPGWLFVISKLMEYFNKKFGLGWEKKIDLPPELTR